MVSGGDALVRLQAASMHDFVLTLGDRDITERFHPYDGAFIARVDGLELGQNIIAAERGGERYQLSLDNYPLHGPLVSGPHQNPYICTTEEFGLGSPIDEHCSAPTQVDYWYVNTSDEFVPLDDLTLSPADARQVTTQDGRTVALIVRREVATINRAIAWSLVPYDPFAIPWEPWSPHATWNRRLIYAFGGNCGVGHWQGDPDYWGFNSVELLAMGSAVVHASLNTLGVSCNDVVSAETASMVKEYFIEQYGAPNYTVGFGGSGGAIQQHLIADNYPGILDGLITLIAFPDLWSILPGVTDCRLLRRHFDSNPSQWPDPQAQAAVTGFADESTCTAWNRDYEDWLVPERGCDSRVGDQVYDPDARPGGVRCTLQDNSVNIFGRDPSTGFARRSYDNRGVQYGLSALLEGTITADQFLDLNESIGGLGVDGEFRSERSRASAGAVRRAYSTGRVLNGGEGLASVPIIEGHIYADGLGNIHDALRMHSLRARLERENGDSDNHVGFIVASELANELELLGPVMDAMDRWLLAALADPDSDRAAAVRRNRPQDLTDRCYATQVPTEGLCPELFPVHGSPRLAAGAPLSNDILQCALTPIDPADYEGRLDAQQLARLESIFPEGVCDWSAAPPNRVPHAGVWQRF